MKMRDLKNLEMPDLSNWGLDDSTTSIIVFVIVAIIVFAMFRKLFRFAMLLAFAFFIFYLFA